MIFLRGSLANSEMMAFQTFSFVTDCAMVFCLFLDSPLYLCCVLRYLLFVLLRLNLNVALLRIVMAMADKDLSRLADIWSDNDALVLDLVVLLLQVLGKLLLELAVLILFLLLLKELRLCERAIPTELALLLLLLLLRNVVKRDLSL